MSDPGRTLYRRSPTVVFYWSAARLIAHDYAARTEVLARPIICEILDYFDRWRSSDDLIVDKPRLDHHELQDVLALLVKHSLLQRNDRAPSKDQLAMETWAEWNPAAGFFHNSTKDLDYGSLRTIDRLMREKARHTPMPDSVKRYPGARLLRLPTARTGGSFAQTLLRRRTWRQFGRGPLTLSALSTLLGLAAGVQAWLTGSGGQRAALKTSPSGGARHAIELYPVVLNVDGLARGLYHYAWDAHALELIDAKLPARPVERYLPAQRWFSGASVLVLFTAVFPRVQWRYSHARAYRAALIEAGHVCQSFCLTATSLGLAPFCSMALADSRIEKDLQLDGIRESVLYAAGVGTRPPGLGWTPSGTIGTVRQQLTRRQERRFPGQVGRRQRGG